MTGTLLLGGRPLEHVRVAFLPEYGPRATGTSDESGRFSMMFDDGNPGAAVGPTRVILTDLWPLLDNLLDEGGTWIDMSAGKRTRIALAYYDMATTPLKVDVKPGQSNAFEFEIEPRTE